MKNFAAISKVFGLDAASKLADRKLKPETNDEGAFDDGFIEALDGAQPDAWDVADEPLNISDSDTMGGDDE